MNDREIAALIDKLKTTMISVATGGPRIDQVRREFSLSYDELTNALQERGLENPFPYGDLWAWYGRWSSGDLPTYQSRRLFVSEIADRLSRQLKNGESTPQILTGWERVDRVVTKIRNQLAAAQDEEEFQQIGHLARELLISLAQAVYVEGVHRPLDETPISKTDYKRMISAFISSEFEGSGHRDLRKYANAALDAANQLQHDRTASFRSAGICVEVTTSIVNIIAIMAGRRDP